MSQRPPVTTASFRVGALDVEPDRNLLKRGDFQIALEPKIMDLLCALAAQGGEVLSREALIEQVWGVQFGGDESLSRAISILRKAFAASGESETYITTVSKRGYQLAQPVRGLVASIEVASTPSGERSAVPDSYSVAVIPIECEGGTTEAQMADDVGRDLVAMFSNAPHLRVASYETALRDRSDGFESSEIGRRLAVHYVVSGSLRRRQDQLMLRLGLIDASNNTHLMSWRLSRAADRFQDQLEDIVLDLSTSIVSEIQIAVGSRAHIEKEGERDGYQVVQSTEMLRALYSEQRAREIVDHLRELIEREPDNPVAKGFLAIQLVQSIQSGWTNTPAATKVEAANLIDAALALAPNDADVLMAAGIVPGMLGDARSAIPYLARSLERNPNNPHTLAVLGWQKCLLDGDEHGIEMIRAAERRAPHHPRFSIWAGYRAGCELKRGRVDEAAEAWRQGNERNPNYLPTYIFLAGALALLNRDGEARIVIDRLLSREPKFKTIDFSDHFRRWAFWCPASVPWEDVARATRRVWPD